MAMTKTSPQTRDVLVIDNGPLRSRHFAEAQKIIQKIEKLEDKIQTFHSSDQKRFDQWFDLTFRTDRQNQEDARQKYQQLARFHNWIIATAHKLDIEMPQAYALMREEQLRWDLGNAEVRQQIDLDREQREAYIRHEFRTRYNENFSFDDDSIEEDELEKNGGIEGLYQVLNRLENQIFEGEQGSDMPAQDRIDRLVALSDEDLVLALDDQEVAFMMFDVSLNWGQTHHDYVLFKRLWSLMTSAQRTFFAYVYHSVTDEPIEEFLVGLGLSPEFDSKETHGHASDDEEDDEEAFAFDEEYIRDPRSKTKMQSARTTVVNDEKLKQTFRKLMRKLHPDVHTAESPEGKPPTWVQRVWGLVQNAYNARNVSGLERLLKLTLIRMNVLDELSVGEISEARHWLRQDLKNLEDESSGLRSSLAWGFSQKKNLNTLTRKISKELESQLREIVDQITELEDQHKLLEVLADQPRRKRSSKMQKKTRLNRSRRQQEFAFED